MVIDEKRYENKSVKDKSIPILIVIRGLVRDLNHGISTELFSISFSRQLFRKCLNFSYSGSQHASMSEHVLTVVT